MAQVLITRFAKVNTKRLCHSFAIIRKCLNSSECTYFLVYSFFFLLFIMDIIVFCKLFF
jgi:hypothetical protein